MAAYGPQAAPGGAAAASGGDGAAAMLEYLSTHGVTAKLNAAVNSLAREKPADPIAYLIEQLKKAV